MSYKIENCCETSQQHLSSNRQMDSFLKSMNFFQLFFCRAQMTLLSTNKASGDIEHTASGKSINYLFLNCLENYTCSLCKIHDVSSSLLSVILEKEKTKIKKK